MELSAVISWLDGVLRPQDFDDVANNGLQLGDTRAEVRKVAFAVDGSLDSVRKAALAGTQLLVVHHGISWGGGLRRLTGGEYAVVNAAMHDGLALAAYHLPLDASEKCGNNWEIARALGMTEVERAFSYHGNVIGVKGLLAEPARLKTLFPGLTLPGGGKMALPAGPVRIGVCSGGAGEFAVEAQAEGCELYLTGEASWGDVIAAENAGANLLTAGHYETEVFGVRALARLLAQELKLETEWVAR